MRAFLWYSHSQGKGRWSLCWNCAVWLLSHGPVVKRYDMLCGLCENWILVFSIRKERKVEDVDAKCELWNMYFCLHFTHSVTTMSHSRKQALCRMEREVIWCYFLAFVFTSTWVFWHHHDDTSWFEMLFVEFATESK